MNRTRWIFVGILALVIIIIGVSIVIRLATGGDSGGQSDLVLERPNTLSIRVLTALPVEPWVRGAAETYNASMPTIDDIPINVEIIAMDGLTALGRWDRNEFGALEAEADLENQSTEDFPTVWIPDSRYLVELVNATYKKCNAEWAGTAELGIASFKVAQFLYQFLYRDSFIVLYPVQL